MYILERTYSYYKPCQLDNKTYMYFSVNERRKTQFFFFFLISYTDTLVFISGKLMYFRILSIKKTNSGTSKGDYLLFYLTSFTHVTKRKNGMQLRMKRNAKKLAVYKQSSCWK